MRWSFRLTALLIAAAALAQGCGQPTPAPRPATRVAFDAIVNEQRDRIPPAALQRAFAYLRDHPTQVTNQRYVTIIDFDQPSTARRMHVIDLTTGGVEDLLVAHGKNSGGNLATQFSNAPGSNMSSLGVYLTGDAITSPRHGPAMLLHGMEPTNDNALRREIILHGADYVSEDFIERNGRLGRSLGCPAVENGVAARLVEQLKGGSVMVIYTSEISSTMTGGIEAQRRTIE
jgi:hypothetical protein